MVEGRKRELATLSLAVPLWYLASAGSVIFLKEILTAHENAISAVIDATSAQLICGLLAGKLYQRLSSSSAGSSPEDELSTDEHDALLLASAFDVAGTAATNWAIVVGGASLSQIFKLMEPPITVVISFALLGERTSTPRLAFMALTCAGVYLSSHSTTTTTSTEPSQDGDDEWSSMRKSVWAVGLMLMGIAFPLRNVYSKRMGPIKGAQAYTEICNRGFELVFPLLVGRIVAGPAVSVHISTNWHLFFFMAFLSAVYNLLSFKVLSYVTPVTHAQLRLGKRIVSLVISIMALHDFALSPLKLLGLVAAFGGLAGYMLSPKSASTRATGLGVVVVPQQHDSESLTSASSANNGRTTKDAVAKAITYASLAFLVLGTNLTETSAAPALASAPNVSIPTTELHSLNATALFESATAFGYPRSRHNAPNSLHAHPSSGHSGLRRSSRRGGPSS